jgi:TolB-like protein/Tfp pilus assembly protein PilF
LTVLGGFALASGDGADLALPTRKDRLLLTYLALNVGRPQDRNRLAGMFWADRGETQARDSLRQSLAGLRQAFRGIGLDPLQSDRDSVALERRGIDVDAVSFAALAETAPGEAVVLYAGELLEGIDGLTSEFDAWLVPERERLNALAIQALERVAQGEDGASDPAVAIGVGRRMLARDGLREPVARALMRLLTRGGERAEALKIYGACRADLQRELGVAPDALTEALYRDILTAHGAGATVQPVAAPASPAQERASIAVLPLTNLSGDGSLDSLCAGLAEDISTGLGRFRVLLVIDRHSSAAVAETTTDPAEIGRKLAVDLLVQGSLQRQGDNVRVTVRLINAASRVQVWGDAFDQPLSDVLAFPDRATNAIVSTLYGRVEHALTSDKRPKPNLAAYECLLRGVKQLRGYGPDDNAKAIALFDQAIALDPHYHLARVYRAFAEIIFHGIDTAPKDLLDAALVAGMDAIEAEGDDGRCHYLLGIIHGFRGEVERELQAYHRALELNPNDADAIAAVGIVLASVGRHEEGMEKLRMAMRLNPYHPEWYWDDLGCILYVAGRYADALEAFQRRSRPSRYVLPRIAASLAQIGRMQEAETAKAKVLAIMPDFSISRLAMRGWRQADAEHFREGMRKAGLPE